MKYILFVLIYIAVVLFNIYFLKPLKDKMLYGYELPDYKKPKINSYLFCVYILRWKCLCFLLSFSLQFCRWIWLPSKRAPSIVLMMAFRRPPTIYNSAIELVPVSHQIWFRSLSKISTMHTHSTGITSLRTQNTSKTNSKEHTPAYFKFWF